MALKYDEIQCINRFRQVLKALPKEGKRYRISRVQVYVVEDRDDGYTIVSPHYLYPISASMGGTKDYLGNYWVINNQDEPSYHQAVKTSSLIHHNLGSTMISTAPMRIQCYSINDYRLVSAPYHEVRNYKVKIEDDEITEEGFERAKWLAFYGDWVDALTDKKAHKALIRMGGVKITLPWHYGFDQWIKHKGGGRIDDYEAYLESTDECVTYPAYVLNACFHSYLQEALQLKAKYSVEGVVE